MAVRSTGRAGKHVRFVGQSLNIFESPSKKKRQQQTNSVGQNKHAKKRREKKRKKKKNKEEDTAREQCTQARAIARKEEERVLKPCSWGH